MKKAIVSLLLILCILAGITASAANNDSVIARRNDEGFDETIVSLSVLDGALIMFSGKSNFYRYSPTDGAINRFVWDRDIQNQMNGIAENGDTRFLSILAQFTWRGGLYVLAQTRYSNDGVFSVELCEVLLNGETASLKPVREIDRRPLDNGEGLIEIGLCCAVGDILCLNAYLDTDVLCLVPLDGSKTTVTKYKEAAFCAYDDILIIAEYKHSSDTEVRFTLMKPATGEIRDTKAKYVSSSEPAGFAYDGKANRLLFTDGGSIVSFNFAFADSTHEVIASVPFEPNTYPNGLNACILE